ncbi:phosphate ABC transporter permease PstA [Rhodobacter sp. HX-7-19]|uniref:Phosphate transport system permease protein PstA n=1 Tax=Paragemmobacter kunshanensis TaxID=2583234 RepID=A0A6M1TY31_9RHOB|nr:phosphate ABC transporter permease PstA [Rhodobacter kunshanensis]NGQ93110.1 phosphate ABC transporter permease PstA [Rhodobacter kunshanensis]
MSDVTAGAPGAARGQSLLAGSARTRARRAREWRMKAYGIAAIAISLATLFFMLATIVIDGAPAFRQATISFPVTVEAAIVDKAGTRDPAAMGKVTTIGYKRLLSQGFIAALEARGIDREGITDKDLTAMISDDAAARLRDRVLADPALVGQTIEVTAYATGRIDGYLKGRVTRESAARDSNVTPAQLDLADRLMAAGMLSLRFNWGFLTGPDASDLRPEAAGLGVAIIGSLYMMVLVAIFTVPVGVAASIYLEEFAPKNRLTDLIEVNISNLAAVPSIVFGILGLAIFINFMGLPQSSSLVGALVISLMTLPTIIIATRAAIRAVPPSIRDAAMGIGASKMQVVFHHVLPLAMPGIMTGTILGLASALGETAPLLLIGMVAFVTNFPAGPLEGGVMDPATALPVQVYSWASRSDPAFIERSSGAIIVLLVFLVIMNVAAILLRRRFERRW